MSIMKMYVEEYLAAEQVAENRYIIHLSNGKEIEVTEHPIARCLHFPLSIGTWS